MTFDLSLFPGMVLPGDYFRVGAAPFRRLARASDSMLWQRVQKIAMGQDKG